MRDDLVEARRQQGTRGNRHQPVAAFLVVGQARRLALGSDHRQPRAMPVAIDLGRSNEWQDVHSGQPAEPDKRFRQNASFKFELRRWRRMLELAPAALPIDRARRVRPVRRRRHDFEETALRIAFLDALKLDADRLARQHALDEDSQRSVMRQPLAAMDQLVDLDEDAFVGLSDLGGHSEMSLTLKAGDAAWAPRYSVGRTAGSARLRRRNAPLSGAARRQDPILERPLAELIELAVLDPIQQRRHQKLRIPQAKPLGLAQHEVHFVADFEHRGKMHEVGFRPLPIPSRFVDEAGNEPLVLAREIDHAAVGVRQQRDRGNLKKERMHTLAEGYHPSLDGAEKCSRRLTATSETNMTPEYRSKIGFKPARIGSTFSCGTTVISITRLSISLNIGWAV